jgi:hypothetical protein
MAIYGIGEGDGMLRLLQGILLGFALVIALPRTAFSEELTKLVTVDMKWQLGGTKEIDKISLHFQKGSADCSSNFYQSGEFAKYIQSFGARAVPVVFSVSYREDGNPSGVALVKVGDWEASRFLPNERLLSTTHKLEPAEKLKLNSPAGCFDPIIRGLNAND